MITGLGIATKGIVHDPPYGGGTTTVNSYGQLDAIVTDNALTAEVTADVVAEVTGDVVAEVTAGVGMIITDDSLEALIDE